MLETPEAELVADAVWLRLHWKLWLPPVGEPEPPSVPDKAGSAVDAPEATPKKTPPPGLAKALSREPRGSLAIPAREEAASRDSTERASPIEVDRPLPLPNRSQLARALRPLARRARRGPLVELDLDATIRRTELAGGRLQVVMRPALRRALALDLLVEESGSMDLWRGLDTDLAQLFEGLGTFRRVGLRYLRSDATRVEVLDRAGSLCGLTPDEEPRLVLLVSDTIGSGWRSGAIFRWLEERGKETALVVVHLFPPDLQDRTALAQRAVTPARSPVRYARNRELAWCAEVPGAARLLAPVPLVTLDIDDLERLPGLVLAHGGNRLAAIAVDPETLGQESSAPPEPAEVGTPVERLREFLRTASAGTRELLDVLAVVPLTPEVIRLAQKRFVPASRHWQVAEILFSGLAKRMDTPGNPGEAGVWYEFQPGVREEILRRGALIREIEVLEGIGGFLRARYGFDGRFGALVQDPGGKQSFPKAHSSSCAQIQRALVRAKSRASGSARFDGAVTKTRPEAASTETISRLARRLIRAVKGAVRSPRSIVVRSGGTVGRGGIGAHGH